MNICSDCRSTFPVPNADGGCPYCNSQDVHAILEGMNEPTSEGEK